MQEIQESNIVGYYSSKLDSKGRCTFPSDLRENRESDSVYIFYSPKYKRAIAFFEPDILQQQFPDDYNHLPIQKITINKDGKLTLGLTFFKKIGAQLSQKHYIHFLRTGKNGNLIEIFFSDDDVQGALHLRNKTADRVMSSIITPHSSHYPFVATTAYSPLMSTAHINTMTLTQ